MFACTTISGAGKNCKICPHLTVIIYPVETVDGIASYCPSGYVRDLVISLSAQLAQFHVKVEFRGLGQRTEHGLFQR
jgi:hypothetical protein